MDRAARPVEGARVSLPVPAPLGVKLAYSLGQFAQTGGFDVAAPFAFFYYTAVLDLGGGLVGLAFALSLAVDALVDPIVGSATDNLTSRFGRRLPPMILAVAPMAAGMVAIFSPPAGLTRPWLFAWLLGASVLFRSSVSLFNVPYVALAAEMSDDYVERSKIVAYRTGVVILSTLAVVIIAYSGVFAGPQGLERRAAYPRFGLAIAALILAFCLTACLGLARFAARLPQPEPRSGERPRLRSELKEVFASGSFRTLFASLLIFFVAVGVNATLQNHAYVYVWGLSPAQIQTVVFAYTGGLALGVAASPILAPRLEKKTLVLLGISAVVLAWAGLLGLRALGIYAPRGPAAVLPLCLNAFFAGAGVGIALIAYPSMMADAADEHEVRFKSRREGLYFAGLGFSSKAAAGAGVYLAGVGLDLIGFPRGAVGRAGHVSEPVLRALMAVHGPLPALLGVAALAALIPYGIDRKRQAELLARRSEDRLPS